MNYTINVLKSKNDIKKFIEFIKDYKADNIAIDFEFHKGKFVRLMQLNIDNKYIYILNPELKIKYKQYLIEFLNNTNKIMNGSISLDVPYIINGLLNNDKNNIYKFFLKFEDTRYLCEYYSILNNNEFKCDIYSAYYKFNVIDEKTYNNLIENYEYMLNMLRSILWEKSSTDDIWNIQNLDGAILYYAVNDVLYLINYSNKLHNNIKNYEFINIINRYYLYDKYNVIDTISKYKAMIDKMNIYFIMINNIKYNLVDIYKKLFENNNFYIDEFNISILLKIYNLKTYTQYLLKIILYRLLIKKYIVYIKKDNIFDKNKFKIKLNHIDKNFKKLIKKIKINIIDKIENL